MIWWIWTVKTTNPVHLFSVVAAWRYDDPDVYWLGECAWTCRSDLMGIGLVG